MNVCNYRLQDHLIAGAGRPIFQQEKGSLIQRGVIVVINLRNPSTILSFLASLLGIFGSGYSKG